MLPQADYFHNRMAISGGPADVARARSLVVRGVDLDFMSAIPLPEALSEAGDPALDHHFDCLAAWGCGEAMGTTVGEDSPGLVVTTFDTPGSPPARVVEALSRAVPGVTVVLDCMPLCSSGEAYSGTWASGIGTLAPVELTAELYRAIRPDAEDWEVEDALAAGDGPGMA